MSIRRRGRRLELLLGLDLAGLELQPYDPPDRLAIALDSYQRSRDAKRLRESLRRYLDWAPGLGDRLLTQSIQQASADVQGAKTRQAHADLLASELSALIEELRPGPRRALLIAEYARFQRRRGWINRWGEGERKLFIYAMRFQQAGLNFYLRRNYRPVVPNWRKALECYLKLGDLDNSVSVLANLGLLHQRHGSMARALPYYQQAWKLVRPSGLILDIALIAHLLGSAHPDPGEAVAVLQAGLEVARRLGQRNRRLALLEKLLLAEFRCGRPGRSEACLLEALSLSMDAAVRTRLLRMGAGLARDTGRHELAIERLRLAVRLAKERRQEALRDLAGAYLDARDFAGATAVIRQLEVSTLSRARFHRLRSRHGGESHRALSDHLRAVAIPVGAGELRTAARWLIDVPPISLRAWICGR